MSNELVFVPTRLYLNLVRQTDRRNLVVGMRLLNSRRGRKKEKELPEDIQKLLVKEADIVDGDIEAADIEED